ncbi:CDP-alcohol phosphatidyltransferase family protein [Aquimarina agarilytica]|uniref:CDP-alcohol phosphatidyltransferase family protein n=1 Tax=Aquimarina agarilytica TaxID=1087449 RepID=UPI0002885D2B|nr:CDP-alcohol phosphatidyltransferase family protein [Aquimarina agarilytica]
MSLKKQIPNIITLLNLFSGCIAVYFACMNQLFLAAVFTALGIFFDFFDGFFARLFNANSELGLQLDSLADMVTSGVVPGVFMFQLLLESSAINDSFPIENIGGNVIEWVPFLGFFVTLASCYRLANFNIDTRQTSSFIGLPTPANTLLIISIGLVSMYQSSGIIEVLMDNVWVLLSIVALSCYLLNAEVRLFALKFKNWNIKDNWVRYLLIISSLVLILLFKYLGITLTILLYVLLSLIFSGEETNGV